MSEKSYSVVETLENKLQCFSACPKTWVSGNYLLWPPKSQIYKSRKSFAAPISSWKNFPIVSVIAENIGKLILI